MNRLIDPSTVPPEYLSMMEHDGHSNPPAFFHSANELFGEVDLRGKRVLEIGSGRGLMSALMGLAGASRVVSLEPELAGASAGMIRTQQERVRALKLANVEVVVADFNTWAAPEQAFDIILSRASINHLHHSDKHALRHRETYENYVKAASKIYSLLVPGGVFIATDASRYAFFTAVRRLGISRPWRRKKTGVNWQHHQTPVTWKRIFKSAAFKRIEVNYPVPHKLQHVRLLADTAPANFFMKGSFILRAYR